MARSRPDKRNQKRKKGKAIEAADPAPDMAQPFFEQATSLLHIGEAEEALLIARKSLKCLSSPDLLQLARLPVLELLGEIYVELGNLDEARKAFEEAAMLDPDGEMSEETGSGADKFLWLAQLSTIGGADSVKWLEKGCSVLRQEIGIFGQNTRSKDNELVLKMKKSKLASALCSTTEVYMTDLSWEDDAEARCESLVTEACLVAPHSPEPLQTLASVRLSQSKPEDAQAALQQSLDIWSALPPEHVDVPDFPTRISLARLLMEATMEEKAMDVLERLVGEDDSSVEAFYLGGWCLHLLAQKQQFCEESAQARTDNLKSSRKWLQNSLRLYALLEYEDERLHDHAAELVKSLNMTLGPVVDADQDEDEEEWYEESSEVEDDSEDEKMTNI